jgi:hypothetical protein
MDRTPSMVVKAETRRDAATSKIDAARYAGATRGLLHDADPKTKNYIVNKGPRNYGKNYIWY